MLFFVKSETTERRKGGLFPALLKYWRGLRGLSQLDLALTADVSTRHVSFLETGRSAPSRDMVLRLASALQVPLRDQNEMLAAANFEPQFDEPDLVTGLTGPVAQALERMMAQHEPYPLAVMDRRYDVLRTNRGGQRLLQRFVADPAALTPPVNACRLLFDPAGARPFVPNWERAAKMMLARLHREALSQPQDDALSSLVEELASFPDVPEDWRQPDFSMSVDPVFTLRLSKDGEELAFLTTLTVFSAPQNVTLEELRIESYYPLDDRTEQACRDAAAI
jgi:transcriptional regulator with XRE-family HTH domain